MSKSLEPAELAKHNVKLVSKDAAASGQIWLTCDKCGARWSPNLQKGGRLPRGFWRCPNGCNAESKAQSKPIADLPPVLTPEEAAALLRMDVSTVKDLARAGKLPGAFKAPGKGLWRVRRDELVAHIMAQGKDGTQ